MDPQMKRCLAGTRKRKLEPFCVISDVDGTPEACMTDDNVAPVTADQHMSNGFDRAVF